MSLRQAALTLLIFVMPGLSWGSDVIGTEPKIYEATKEVCSRVTAGQALGRGPEIDRFHAGIFPSPKFNRLLGSITQESLGRAATKFEYQNRIEMVAYVTQNPGFRRALTECYPDDPRMHIYFSRVIHKADLRGKVVGGAATVVLFAGTKTLIGQLGKLGKQGVRLVRTLEFSAIAALVYAIYADFKKAARENNYYKRICGDPADTDRYSACVVGETETAMQNLKDSFTKRNEANAGLETLLIKMAGAQILENERELAKPGLTDKEKARLLAEVADRRNFIQETEALLANQTR